MKDEEVTFQDLNSGHTTKAGYCKIRETCRIALENGLKYAWVDTCCIDKNNSAELSKAINSMFQYYEDAKSCYIYLSDVSIHPEKLCSDEGPSRW